jgi:hypothetical protein
MRAELLDRTCSQFSWNVINIDQRLVRRCAILLPCRPIRLAATGDRPPIRKEHPMPEIFARPEPSLIPIARPRCPKCQSRMTLTRIEPDHNNPDLRTFECPECEFVYKLASTSTS